jgi:hypothetical protein
LCVAGAFAARRAFRFAPRNPAFFPENVLFFCGKKKYNSFVLCNLSPQGDGNMSLVIDERIDSITTYPRKGTETVSCNRATYTRFDYNLSPQGDGNTQKVLHASWIVLLQLIPVKPSQALRASSPEGRA